MKIALTYSTKEGLQNEFKQRFGNNGKNHNVSEDFFAEGDNPKTINAIINALVEKKHQVYGFESDSTIEKRLEIIRPDIVFNIAEGLWGDLRESRVPYICEQLGLPYTGSDPLTLAICLNKSYTKKILYYHKIPTADFFTISSIDDKISEYKSFPYILKPVAEGSSKGIFNHSIVQTISELNYQLNNMLTEYNQDILIEKYLSGREFTVAMWGNGKDIEVLPIIEISYSQLPEGAWPIYSYEAKWIWDTQEKPLDIFQCPAELTPQLEKEIEEIAIHTYRAMKIRDWCRIDVRLDENNKAHIIELNPLPGILPDPKENSCFPKAARAKGYDYNEMINKVLEIACKRHGIEI